MLPGYDESGNCRIAGCLITGIGVVGSITACLTIKISNYVGIAKSPHRNKT